MMGIPSPDNINLAAVCVSHEENGSDDVAGFKGFLIIPDQSEISTA